MGLNIPSETNRGLPHALTFGDLYEVHQCLISQETAAILFGTLARVALLNLGDHEKLRDQEYKGGTIIDEGTARFVVLDHRAELTGLDEFTYYPYIYDGNFDRTYHCTNRDVIYFGSKYKRNPRALKLTLKDLRATSSRFAPGLHIPSLRLQGNVTAIQDGIRPNIIEVIRNSAKDFENLRRGYLTPFTIIHNDPGFKPVKDFDTANRSGHYAIESFHMEQSPREFNQYA